MMSLLFKATFQAEISRVPETLRETGGRHKVPPLYTQNISARDLQLGTRKKDDQTNKVTSFVFVYVT